jgi:hypothetical protein
MEQTSEYPRMILIEEFDRATIMAAPVHEAINMVSAKLFNAKAFELKDGKATGFFATHID